MLLCSERDGVGKPLAPAAGLALVARLVAGVGKVEELIAPLADGGAAWDALVDWRLRPEFKSAKRVQPPVHYEFGRDLLRIRRDGEGQVRPQSPSRLETLLVSPLAWLLEELSTKPVDWQPEALDVMGLDDTADTAAIKAQYKTLVKRFHPDANGGDRSFEERLRDIIRAHDVLRAAGLC